MKRNTGKLGAGTYDLLVVGGGIHGACVARDAALRGLRVALVERGDFGGETSHNSLKLIHGGLRYLQHADLRRVRESILERRFWLRMAPHLVRPLKFVIPTYGHATRGPEVLRAAIKLHELIGLDWNQGVSPNRHIPQGRIVSKEECLHLIPGIDKEGLTGGAIWYDGQMQDANRVLIECIIDAAQAGADVANYVMVEGFVRSGRRIEGTRARDLLENNELEIRANVTVNTCGPWASDLLNREQQLLGAGVIELSKGMNLVTRPLFDGYAVGVVSRRVSDSFVARGGRLYFITPWRDRAVIGTTHFPYEGSPDEFQITEEDIQGFLDEINSAYPPAQLRKEDVLYCYSGLTPAEEGKQQDEVKRSRHSRILDHEKLDQVQGILSVVGVKYTTARLVAERAVDLVFSKLGRTPPPCGGKDTLLPGARGFQDVELLEREAVNHVKGLVDYGALRRLLESYGTAYRRVFELGALSGEATADALFRCQCRYAVREELALRLQDLLLTRTDLAARGELTEELIQWCASMMAAELGWSEKRIHSEVQEARRKLERQRATISGPSASAPRPPSFSFR
jgi:glycerol-3-phosphate dehydrogenase